MKKNKIEKMMKYAQDMSHLSEEDKAGLLGTVAACFCTTSNNKFKMSDSIMLMLIMLNKTQQFLAKELHKDPESRGDAENWLLLEKGMNAIVRLMEESRPALVNRAYSEQSDKAEGLIDAAVEAQRILQRAKGRGPSE